MTYPDLSPYYSDNNMTIKGRMEESYRQSMNLYQQFWNEADIDTRFFCGDQTLWNILYNGFIPLTNRRQFQFNRIRRIINMVTGYQRRNRKTTIATPSHEKDQQLADDFSGVLQWQMNDQNVYNTLSDAFQCACVTGFNLLNCWVDYRFDPINGDIRVDNESYNSIVIDPTFKKQDLTDANFIWKRKWMSKKQIASLLPEREDEILAMPYSANRDDKFIFLPENFQYSLRNLLPWDEYWYLDYRDAKILVDTQSQETLEWTGDKQTLDMFLHMNPSVQVQKIQKQTCRLAISVGNRIMYDGPNPYGSDKYPFIGVFGYFEPEIPYFSLKMQGMVRGLRDAQFLYNRRKVIELDMLESQINSGIKFKESALIDPNDAFLSGQGRMLALKDSAQMTDVEVMRPPEIPASTMQLSQMLGEEIAQISGVNEELLGSATDEKAGILSMLRQGAGLTTLQILFDQLDMSQKLLGELMIDYHQINSSKAKIEQILGRPASDEFENRMFPRYRCNVEEGFMTTSQKQMQFMQVMQMKEAGLNIPDSLIIDLAQIQDKKKLMDAIEQQNQQQQQQAQAQQQSDIQQQQVLTDSLGAKAESDRALAQERLTKIGLDQALNYERIVKAQEERDMGSLAKIRAAKELEGMDISHLKELVSVLESLQARDDIKAQQIQPQQPQKQKPQNNLLENAQV